MSTSIAPASWKFAALPLLILPLFAPGLRALSGSPQATVTAAAPPREQIAANLGGGSCQAPSEPAATPALAAPPSALPAPARRRHLPGDEGCREVQVATAR
jgi:hypothetical protein